MIKEEINLKSRGANSYRVFTLNKKKIFTQFQDKLLHMFQYAFMKLFFAMPFWKIQEINKCSVLEKDWHACIFILQSRRKVISITQ